MSNFQKDGGPAFPTDNEQQVGHNTFHYEGMTLRDYFAAASVPAIIQVCANDMRRDGESREQYFARAAYAIADAMLAERAK
jgi:hypothetical protein